MSASGIFKPGSTVSVNIVHIGPAGTAQVLKSVIADGNGAVSTSATIPSGSDTGIYFIYLEGIDVNGNRVVALVPIVVRSAPAGAAQSGSQSAAVEANSVQAVAPAEVTEVQQDLSPKAEAAVVEAVSAGQAGLVLSPQGRLEVRTANGTVEASSLASTGRDLQTPATIGAALVLAGTGLVLLRRRKAVLR